MNTGARKAGGWGRAPVAVPAPAIPEAIQADPVEDMPALSLAPEWRIEEEPVRISPLRRAAGVALVLLALAWVAALGWIAAGGGAAYMAYARDGALACVPLTLLAALFVVLRGGNALRFGGNAAAVEAQVCALDAQLATLGARLAAGRAQLTDHARAIAEAGSEASGRLTETRAAMQADAALLSREGRALEFAAAAARADLAVLVETMPGVEQHARGLAAALRDSGAQAAEKVAALDGALAALAERGQAVDENAGGAARRLAGEIGRLDRASEATARRMDEAAGRLGAAVGQALTQAAEALEQSRAGIDAQAAAVRALIEEARTVLADAGAQAHEASARRLAGLQTQVEAIGERLAAQDRAAHAMVEGLDTGLDALRERLAALGESGAVESARLAAAVRSVASYAEQVRDGLVVGGDAADALIVRATQLSERLEIPARQLHETMPEALQRIEQQTRRSLAALGEVTPQAARLDESMAGMATRLESIGPALAAQVEANAVLVAEIDRQLAASTGQVQALGSAIGEADATARHVAEGAVSALVEAMVRVRATAQQAAERAREAIAAVIPDSADMLARAGEAALSEGVTRAVEGQMARLQSMSEEATGAAGRAAERLAGHMLQLSETTAMVEQRIASAQEQAEAVQAASFPRRAAHLIDALNSAAIDVAKILSNEIGDTVWAAYLKGDRGVFTRRAVRLLESGDARDIGRLYGEDPEFRDQVNRYVHDFEALLRPIMAARDSAPLAVTLLGSDMGKLYVALAQAISRLRN